MTSKQDVVHDYTWEVLDDFMAKFEELVDSDFILPDVVSDDVSASVSEESSRLRVLPLTTSGREAGIPPSSKETTATGQMADIAVWVSGREKLLTGVSRSTTCQDIVQTLLGENLKKDKGLGSCVQKFALYERWRDCERPLAPRTRVYKLWKAWGSERENVKFIMKKYSPNKLGKDSSAMKGGNRDRTQKEQAKRQCAEHDGREYNAKGLSLRRGSTNKTSRNARDKDKDLLHISKSDDSTGSSEAELIPSIICGPEIIGKDDANSLPNSLINLKSATLSADTFGHLVQLVVRQSQQLEELLEQAQEIDREIEFYETKMHLLRVEENGKNYVQDAYLSHDGDTESKMAEIITGMYPIKGSDELETHIDLYERILQVEEQLSAKRSTITILSRQIEQQEANCTQPQSADLTFGLTEATQMSTPDQCADTMRERFCETKVRVTKTRPQPNTTLTDDDMSDDLGLTRAQLEKSVQTCVAQRTEIATLQNQLQTTETLLDDKCHWMKVLSTELQRLEEREEAMILSVEDGREETRLQELLQLVRQPLQPIQELSEEDIGQLPDISNYAANEEIYLEKKPVSDDASSDTGLSSLHSQDDPEQVFEVVTETLV